jgi:hypothetical protein
VYNLAISEPELERMSLPVEDLIAIDVPPSQRTSIKPFIRNATFTWFQGNLNNLSLNLKALIAGNSTYHQYLLIESYYNFKWT